MKTVELELEELYFQKQKLEEKIKELENFLKNQKSKDKKEFSKDEKIDLWKKIILKDSIQDWIHYSVKLNNTDVEKKYAVTAIPVKILIDLDGKIIGRWKGGGDENKSEIEKALNDIFKLHE